MKYASGLFLAILFCVCEIHSLDNSGNITASIPAVVMSYDLMPGIDYAVTGLPGNKFAVINLSADKTIIYNRCDIDNKPVIEDQKSIYRYELQDNLIYLQTFYHSNRTYIIHQEKFSYEIIMNYFSDNGEISKVILGSSNIKPSVYIYDNKMNIYYNDMNEKAVVYKNLDLEKFKFKSTTGMKNVEKFSVYCDEPSGNILSLWKNTNELKNIYISPADKDQNGLSNIIQLKFKQNTPIPFHSIDDRFVYFVFVNDFKNSFLKYPITDDIRNHMSEALPDIFNEYETSCYKRKSGIQTIVFKKEMIQNNVKRDELLAGFFDDQFHMADNVRIQGIKGTTSNIKCFLEDESTVIFWLEQEGDKSMIRYTKIKSGPYARNYAP